ncbi:MAG: hypothetical protein LYZ70_06850 [Nitrososphaerales archaeon]|nr:hypothetical protein [Nitrososphaerales archaeon]
MRLNPLLARLMLTILSVLMVLSIFEVVLAIAAGDTPAFYATSLFILVLGFGLAFVGSMIRKQSVEE